MPSTRGNVTLGECPCRVLSSDRFRPAPRTRTKLQPSRTAGTGTSWTSSTSGLPALTQTAARIVIPMPRTVVAERRGLPPAECQLMPIGRQPSRSHLWPGGGAHLWPAGATSPEQSHARGHLVYAARGVLSVHTDRGTSIVPANRVAWTPAGYAHHHRAHGDTDMRIVFLPPSLARLVPDHPAVFTASDLAREALLVLTGPRSYDPAERPLDRGARARLRRVLVDELHQAPEQPLHLPEPTDDRLRAVARVLRERPEDNTPLAELGRRIGASGRTLSRLF